MNPLIDKFPNKSQTETKSNSQQKLEAIGEAISSDIDHYMNRKIQSSQLSWIEYLSNPQVELIKTSVFSTKSSENISELIHQIRHIHVIDGFLRSRFCFEDTVEICHPTQTSGDNEADLMTPNCALEAYGGVDITNNLKLHKTLKNLKETEKKHLFIGLYENSTIPPVLKEDFRFERTFEGKVYKCHVLGSETTVLKNNVKIRIFKVDIQH